MTGSSSDSICLCPEQSGPLNETVTFLFVTWDWWERNTTPGHLTFHRQSLCVELIRSQVAAGHWLLCYSMWESWVIRSTAATGTDFISGFKYPDYNIIAHEHFQLWNFFRNWVMPNIEAQMILIMYPVSLTLISILCSDPARVINMPPVIYVPRKLPGIIRCPVDANPPVTSVKWEKDGYPLRVEKVSLPQGCVWLPFHLSYITLP